jgi:hypothetical protein
VQVPLDLAAAMTLAVRAPKALVAIELLYASWQADGEACTLPAGRLDAAGVDRQTRRRALLELEAANLVTLERRPGRPFLVRVLR